MVGLMWGDGKDRRGAWQLLDIYLVPDHREVSAWLSLAFGTVVVVSWVLTQQLCKCGACREQQRSEKHGGRHWLDRTVVQLALLLAAFATVCFWRGVWLLQDEYILRDYPRASNWLSFSLGCLCLAVLNATRSLLAPPFVTSVDLTENPSASRLTIPTYRSARCAAHKVALLPQTEIIWSSRVATRTSHV
jgi:hypothetical protein